MIGEERITVDDALISTDVDKLIKVISTKRTVDIYELQRATSIDRKVIDKWLKVLDDEGYIRIDYRITNTYIVWLGEEKADEDLEEPITAEGVTELDETNYKKPEIESLGPDTSPELEDSKPPDDLEENSEIVTHVVPENKIETTIDESISKAEEEYNKTISEDVSKGEEETAADIVRQREEENPAKAAKEEKAKMRNLVNVYMNDIVRQKEEIERLNHQKEVLYRDKYTDLESKVQSELATITERILEKEGRVLELKERVLELPDKVDELEKMHAVMEKLETEGRNIIKKTKTNVERFMKELKGAETEIHDTISKNKGAMEEQKKKINDLSNIGQALDARIEKINDNLNETNSKIKEMTETMNGMFEDLQEASRMKAEIAEITNNIHGSLGKKEDELSGLEEELQDIRKVEEWIREYVNDYEQKVSEIEEYVKTSDEEIGKLRESAEKEYIKKYLHELENLTNIYERELESAGRDEKDIDKRISESKERLEDLIGESKLMLRKLIKETGEGEEFVTLSARSKERSVLVKKMIEEKEMERDRLSEDAKAAKEKRGKRAKPKDKKDKKGKK